MDRAAISKFLISSLHDGRLSRSEKAELRNLLALDADEGHERDWLRNEAFEVAQKSLGTVEAPQVLGWLEAIMGLMTMAERPGRSQASNIAEALFSPGHDCRNRIQKLLREAKTSIHICVFTITDDRVTDCIVDAHARGVQVRVISDNDKAHDPGSDLHRMRRADLQVAFDRTPDHMHHKFAVFDNRLLVSGSYNWTRSASDRNEENIIVTSDERLVQKFARRFESLWKEFGGPGS